MTLSSLRKTGKRHAINHALPGFAGLKRRRENRSFCGGQAGPAPPAASQQAAVRHQSYGCLSGAFRAGAKGGKIENAVGCVLYLDFYIAVIALVYDIIYISALIVNINLTDL